MDMDLVTEYYIYVARYIIYVYMYKTNVTLSKMHT